MANERAAKEPTTVESLLTEGEQMKVVTVGFGIYPTRSGGTGHSCDGVAFPRVDLVRHRPLLTLPKACVEDFDGPFPVKSDHGWIAFDLTGFSASFEGVSGMSLVIDEETTRDGDIPNPVDPSRLDFNLLPDTHTFMRGLELSPHWRDSRELMASFTFLPGRIGGSPDYGTNNVTSHWGFSDQEMAKVRRKTNVTVHVSDALPTRTIQLRRVASDAVAGWIRVKPAISNRVVALLTNGWVDDNGDYDAHANGTLVNLSHVQAMLAFCEPASNDSVKVDFGRKSGAPGDDREIAAAARRAFAGSNVVDLFAQRIKDVTILYNSDVSCSGRRMSMS